LNDGGKASSAGRQTGRLREGLVALQLALSVVLLVGAGLMVRSFVNLAHVDLGFRTGDALTFRLALPEVGYGKETIAPFYQRAGAALRAIPGVQRASGATMSPFGGQWWRTFLVEGESKTRLAELPAALNVVVTPGYFATMGIPLDRGRDFSDADGTAAPVVIVNRALANRYWPGQDPLGRRVKIDSFLPDSPWRTVVGVAGDVRWTNPRDPAPMTVYVPHAFEPMRSMTMVVRSTAPVPALARDVRSVMRRLDPELPLAAVRPLSAVVSRAMWNFRLYTQMFALFAGIAIVLAAVGLGGIMTQMVIERTHEIGIRVAVGATPGDIVAMVVRRVSLLVLLGIGAGLAGALALARTLSTLLFGVTPEDVPTLALVLVLLGLVAFVAGLIPARQASRVSPLLALRAE
jgi:putative ABC transport system permease protein